MESGCQSHSSRADAKQRRQAESRKKAERGGRQHKRSNRKGECTQMKEMENTMEQTAQKISEIGIVPVIKLNEPDDSKALARALSEGGIPAAELTFRAAGAEKAIAAMREAFADMVVGAGTVVNAQQAQRAIEAGARFVVSPGFDAEIVELCLRQNVLPLPGCVTPTEIMQALKWNLHIVKFFPAAQFGGLATIRALAAPFASVKFMPTGGISLENLAEFAADRRVAACGGSFMVAEKLLDARQWDEVTRLCAEAVRIVKNARGQA